MITAERRHIEERHGAWRLLIDSSTSESYTWIDWEVVHDEHNDAAACGQLVNEGEEPSAEHLDLAERLARAALAEVLPERRQVWTVEVPLDCDCAVGVSLASNVRSMHLSEASAEAEAKRVNAQEGRRGDGVCAFVDGPHQVSV